VTGKKQKANALAFGFFKGGRKIGIGVCVGSYFCDVVHLNDKGSVSMVSFMIGDVRIVFLIATVILALLAFIYPISAISGQIDERDTSLKASKKNKRVDPATMAPVQNAGGVPGSAELPSQAAPAPSMPQEPVPVSAEDFYANRPVQGPDMQQAPVAPDPTAFLNSEVPGSYAPEGDDNGNGGDYNG
jgi:hypothetical protein